MALDTEATIIRFQWTELPMPKAVIDRVNQIGKNRPSILTFTNRHGKDIGDTTQDFYPEKNDDKPLNDEITGVEQINDKLTGMDLDGEPTGVDFNAKPTGVEAEADHGEVHEPSPQADHEDNGLGQKVLTPEVTTDPSSYEPSSLQGSSRLAKKWKYSYVPSYKGTKYDVALTQVTKSLQGANNAKLLAQMSIKLMSKRVHRKADTVGAIMAQLSMKAAIKKWGKNTELAITNKMKQLHWRNLYQPKHWNDLFKTQKDQILKSHIFCGAEKRWQDQGTQSHWW